MSCIVGQLPASHPSDEMIRCDVSIIHPKIEIIVSRVGSSRDKRTQNLELLPSGEPASFTNSRKFLRMTGTGDDGKTFKRHNKLPPLILPGDGPEEQRTRSRLLSPGRPIFRTRTPSPVSRKISGSEINFTTFHNNCIKTINSFGSLNCLGGMGQSNSVHNSNSSLSTTSRYHQCCIPIDVPPVFIASPVRKSSFMKFQKPDSLSVISSPNSNRLKSPSPTPHRLLSPSSSSSVSSAKSEEMDPGKVERYLIDHPQFVNTFVQQHVSLDTLQEWINARSKSMKARRLSLATWKFGNNSNKCAMLKELATQIHRPATEGNVIWELAHCISSAISASSFVVYLFDPETNHLRRFSPLQSEPKFPEFAIDENDTLASYVCRRHESQIMSRSEAESKFKHGLGDNKENLEGSAYILCHPIVKSDGEISGVIEFHRRADSTPFYKEDEEIVNSYLVWGGVALHYADLNLVLSKQKNLNDFLLGVVKSIFQDMVSMDAVIKKVMNFAQRLVDADRASLFLVDSKTKELYARIFDMGSGADEAPGAGSSEAVNEAPVKEIRFPMGTGIAGQVATSGGILNIADAYQDPRFNRGVDQVTGYQTRTILCMPVFIRSTVIGVVQMVNKRRGLFTEDDEKAFETFAGYCGLALHHAKLYDKIRRSEQKYRVALEVLSYHTTCAEDEFFSCRAVGVAKPIPGLDDFYFKPMSIDAMQKVYYSVYQFVDLFGLTRFELDSLYRFILTVKKNYRAVPYHNWSHAFTVANCMYCILKKSEVFRPLECLALYIGSLAHDLDHRGRNNKFMLETSSPLASIYTTSTLEHHHFNQTVTILQQEGHNIFAKLTSDEYKQVLGNIKHCILATDLATFFPNRAKLAEYVTKDTFSWGVTDHRLLTQAIAMTASDLCASAKPWEIQAETVKVIFEEFYAQGDLERKAGRTVLPMMDRNRADELPASQVGFLTGICIPCYSVLSKLIPETKPLLNGCNNNLKKWKEMDDDQKKKQKESPDHKKT